MFQFWCVVHQNLCSILSVLLSPFSFNRLCTNSCIKRLQKQAKPKGAELADDEFILHVDGTATTQRVVRHIGGTSWPGLCLISFPYS